jgi:hypothetical protein
VYSDAVRRYRQARKTASNRLVPLKAAAQERRDVAPVLLWLAWARRQRDWVATGLLTLLLLLLLLLLEGCRLRVMIL